MSNDISKGLKIGIVTLFLSYASLCYASDFRKGYFGMSLEEIKALEPDFTYSAEDKFLYRNVELAGRKVQASYHFVDGFFVEGRYGIKEEYKNSQAWINEFLNFESLLITKYGTPDKSQEKYWRGALSLYKYKEDLLGRADTILLLGTAIQRGLLVITSRWKTLYKKVTLLQIKGNDDLIFLTIYYSSLKHDDLIRKRDSKDL